jgi:hypothetical protein
MRRWAAFWALSPILAGLALVRCGFGSSTPSAVGGDAAPAAAGSTDGSEGSDGGGSSSEGAARDAREDALADDGGPLGVPEGAAPDAPVEASDDAADAGLPDAPPDSSADSATDAPSDAPSDAPLGLDASEEAHEEPPVEAGTDAGAEDLDGGCSTAVGGLLANGGFECPTVTAGSYLLVSPGSTFAGWTVVGASGNVAILSGTFTTGSLAFPAHSGAQTLDLTGVSNTVTGVQQVVPTSIGTVYTLSFWVGNIYDATGSFGTSSTVDALVDGTQVLSAVNTGGSGTSTLSWQQFSVQFTATGTSTTIALMNGDASNDSSNILDDVTLN